ncbi:hypothetical protein M5X06_28025 [Paenibacillus alvei]|uniref:Uncharacterized protein n=1 Tax=Paenibacillus alvei TaxID=44250 RepID=A0ABT4GQN3_PAEAL|nr:hypothetical protein [Paenibacillus alvei]MCY9758955.1 hypothetical protein [Paenibacillus alvei]MCY9770628.1 hypothetical protein [Paenibacillus alvei]
MSLIEDLMEAIYNYEREHGEKPEKVIVSIEHYDALVAEEEGRRTVKDKPTTIMGIPLEKKQNQTEDYTFD